MNMADVVEKEVEAPSVICRYLMSLTAAPSTSYTVVCIGDKYSVVL